MEWIWIEREEQNPTGGRGCVMGLDCERREEPYRRERVCNGWDSVPNSFNLTEGTFSVCLFGKEIGNQAKIN